MPPDEFFEPITETKLYVLIPRTVLTGLSVCMKCAAESSDVNVCYAARRAFNTDGMQKY
jgi:hypothetical protein